MRMKSIIIASAVLFAVVIAGYYIQHGSDKELETSLEAANDLDKVINETGQFVQNNRSLFLAALDRDREIKDEDVAFWVNDLPVSNEELRFRFGLWIASGAEPQTIDPVKDILVREKLIQEEATELGLLPTDIETEEFINKEKQSFNNDSDYRDTVGKIIKAWGLTEHEYWNIYEWDNVYRLLTADNLQQYLLKDTDKIDEEWNKFIEDKVIKAEIRDVNLSVE